MPSKPTTKAKPTTIDEYLAALSHDKRAALERLRNIIRAAAPGVEECISYQLPAFRLNGRWLVWIGAAANHCAMYGVGGAHADELKAYDTSGEGTIRFQVDNPLPRLFLRKGARTDLFVVFYVVLARGTSVIAVMHGRRHPRRWQARR